MPSVFRTPEEASAGYEFVAGETPAKTSTLVWTLAATPIAGSLVVYLNGVRLKAGAQNDYTLSGSTISFHADYTAALDAAGVIVQADYRYEVTG